MDLDALRQEYETTPLDRAALAPTPIEQIERWLAGWLEAAPNEPTAMVLSTVGADGRPSARNVLLRTLDERGLTFFTSYDSAKGQQLTVNPQASLLFSWVPVLRQIHIVGSVERVPAEESDAYWVTRPRGSQLAAWASEQSAVLRARAVLEERVTALAAQYEGADIPRPPTWGGFRLAPDMVEFWQGRPNRLHDRLRYQRPDDGGDGWEVVRLNP